MNIEDTNSTIRQALELLLPADLGVCVSLDGILYIRQVESGEFCVGVEGDAEIEDWEQCFVDLAEAIDRFLHVRNECQIGMDFTIRACQEKFGLDLSNIPLVDDTDVSSAYDEDADVLYVTIGTPRKCLGEEIAPGVVERRDLQDESIIGGVTFIGFREYHCKLNLVAEAVKWGLPDPVIYHIAKKAEQITKE